MKKTILSSICFLILGIYVSISTHQHFPMVFDEDPLVSSNETYSNEEIEKLEKIGNEIAMFVLNDKIRELIVFSVLFNENEELVGDLRKGINIFQISQAYFEDIGIKPSKYPLALKGSELDECYDIARIQISDKQFKIKEINQKDFPKTIAILKKFLNKREITDNEFKEILSANFKAVSKMIVIKNFNIK